MDFARLLLILVFFFGFLFLGCTETEEAPTMENETHFVEEPKVIEEVPTPPPPAQIPNIPKSEAHIRSRAYEELLLSGAPIKCTLQRASGSELVNATIYQRGYDYLRISVPGQEASELIMGGGKRYELNPQYGNSSDPTGTCIWIENRSSAEEIFLTSQKLIPEFCKEWEFDYSVFVPPESEETCHQKDKSEEIYEGDISEKTFQELPATNRALHCQFTIADENNTLQYEVHMRGKDRVKVVIEAQAQGTSSNCTEWTHIVRSEIMYVGCTQGCMYCKEHYGNNGLTDCIWELREVSTFDSLNDMLASQMNCRDWAYDESLFAPAHGDKVCTEEEVVGYFTEIMGRPNK